MSADMQVRLIARALYEMRLLLSGYLGSAAPGDASVREAAHLAYALHNEALALAEGRAFDLECAREKLRAVDAMLGCDLVGRLKDPPA